MRVLVTGSSGHLGEALVRVLESRAGLDVVGLDLKASSHTNAVGSIVDRDFVAACMEGVDVVYHTATLHKPHIATHPKQAFVDTNVSGTLALLEAAVDRGVRAFVFTSTTSVFGDALRPPAGTPAAWITEETAPVPKNIYGVTKSAAEELCHLFHRKHGLPCIVLRTSRFFPEEDDDERKRERFTDANIKANEYLNRRVELADVVDAHTKAADKAAELGFGRYVISATTPLLREDLLQLNTKAVDVVRRRVPAFHDVYASSGWTMFDRIDRVYVNEAARADLGWQPRFDFGFVLKQIQAQQPSKSRLAIEVGSKGYHDEAFEDGPYPVEE